MGYLKLEGAVAAPFYAGAMSILALGRYALQISAINAQQFASGGRVELIAIQNGRINTRKNIPTQRNGDNVLATVRTGEVILNERQQHLLGGANVFKAIGVPGFATGGAVNFNPYPYAPQFTPAAYYVNNTNNNSEVVDKLEEMNQKLDAHTEATNARIDRMEVYQVTSTVTNAQKKQVKQNSLGRL